MSVIAQSSSPWRRFASAYGQELIILACILVMIVGVGSYNPRFLNGSNLTAIFAGNSYIAIAAIGMSILIITGHIDVSVGSLIGVLATIAGTLATKGYPIIVAWVVPIIVGIIIYTLVGALVAYARIPSIVVTLGMLSILKGGLITATGGTWITDMPEGFFIAQQRWFGIPAPVWFMILLTLAAAFWLSNSPTGRSFYAVGGNPEAARSLGIDPRRTTIKAFAIHGFFAGLAAILFATQLQVIQSTVPPGLELTIITASVIGGVSILGGTGTVIGSTLAAFLFSCIASSLVFLNFSPYWLRAVMGLLILVTVLLDMARRRNALRKAAA